ncbi:MAG: uroporphyrinogen decarboxylase family protein [Nitrososphaeria archaeon]
MHPKDRVLAALNHEETDRVPIDLGGTVTSMHFKVYKDLLNYLGLDEKIYLINKVGGTVCPSENILKRFNVDTRYIYPKVEPFRETFPVLSVDAWGIKRKFTGYYYDLTEGGSPLANAESVYDINSYNWPKPEDLGFNLDYMIEQGERLSTEDYAVVFPYVIVGSFAHAMLLRGFKQFLSDLILRPKIAEAILDNITNIMVESIKKFISPIGKYLDVIFFGDDLGTQNSPIISPQIYNKFVKPRHIKIVEAFKSISKAKIIIHSDGSILPLLDSLIDAGIDGINPVQVSAKDMDSKLLKEKFGYKLIFWGGIDTQHVLPFGKPDDVADEVRRRVCDLARGGGYILASVHNIQPFTPPENVVKMFDYASSLKISF